ISFFTLMAPLPETFVPSLSSASKKLPVGIFLDCLSGGPACPCIPPPGGRPPLAPPLPNCAWAAERMKRLINKGRKRFIEKKLLGAKVQIVGYCKTGLYDKVILNFQSV